MKLFYRYLNNAEIAPHISGANYTFFVPDDKAFEKLGYNKLRDEVLVSIFFVKKSLILSLIFMKIQLLF